MRSSGKIFDEYVRRCLYREKGSRGGMICGRNNSMFAQFELCGLPENCMILDVRFENIDEFGSLEGMMVSDMDAVQQQKYSLWAASKAVLLCRESTLAHIESLDVALQFLEGIASSKKLHEARKSLPWENKLDDIVRCAMKLNGTRWQAICAGRLLRELCGDGVIPEQVEVLWFLINTRTAEA